MSKYTKNIAVACGLGDLFIFMTRLQDFYKKNPDYSSVKFWAWNHSPNLAKEFVSLCPHNASLISVDDMVDYLDNTLVPSHLRDKAKKAYITQNRTGVGVDKFIGFMDMFFPNIEQWIYLPVYSKYNSTYPYMLKHATEKRDRPYFVVHPFSSAVKTEKPERTWTPTRWGHAIKTLVNLYKDHDVYIIGGASDKIEDRETFQGTDLRGKLSITESVSLVYGAKAVFGINSWPTLLSTWAGIPTYVQWFVQHQLLETHHPEGYDKMPHLVIEKNLTPEMKEERYFYPTAAKAWDNMQRVLAYANSNVQRV